MKKIVIILIFLGSFCFNFKPFIVNAEAQDRLLVLNDVSDLDAYFSGENYQILKYLDHFEYLWGNNKSSIKGELLAHFISSNTLYVLVKDDVQRLIKINNGEIEKQIILDNELVINKIIYDHNLYLFGSLETTGIIIEYNDNLQEIKRYSYGTNNNLKFIDAIRHNNKWYITATKDGHSPNGEFRNIGNYDDTKTVLIRLNSKYMIDNVLYINNESKEEKPIFMEYYNESIYFVVRDSQSDYCYKTDLNFEYCYNEGVYEQTDRVLLGYNGEFLRFNLEDSLVMYEKDHIYHYDNINVKGLDISNSYLNVYTNENNNLYKYEIEEYHINYINEFFVGFDYGNYDFSSNLNDSDVISIKSFFSEVSVFNETTFTNNIPGTYELSLIIKRPNLRSIQVSTKVHVGQYVNIIDNGVYKTGINLKFLGLAKLNEQTISNGHIIQSPGDYKLAIQDNLGNITYYHFTCVDNFYIGGVEDKNSDYYVEKNQNFYFPFSLNTKELVQDVIINGESYEFIQEEEKLKILIKGANLYNIKEYVIEKVKVNDIWYNVDKHFKVMTLKDTPKVTIKEQEGDFLNLDISIEDFDKTIQKVELLINGKEYINYLEDYTYSFDLDKKEVTSIDVNVYYDLGNGEIKSFNLIKLNGKIKDFKNLISLSFNITHSLEKMSLRVNTNNIKNLNFLNVNSVDIKDHYINSSNYLNIYLSIGISILVVLIIIVLVIRKKKKKLKKE